MIEINEKQNNVDNDLPDTSENDSDFYKERLDVEEEAVKKSFQNLSQNELNQLMAVSVAHRSELNGGVYFLKNKINGTIKIGCASNIFKRIRSIDQIFSFLGMDSSLELVAVHFTFCKYTNSLESFYHKLFEQYRYKKEWFRLPENWGQIMVQANHGLAYNVGGIIVGLNTLESFPNVRRNYRPSINQITIEPIEFFAFNHSDLYDLLNFLNETNSIVMLNESEHMPFISTATDDIIEDFISKRDEITSGNFPEYLLSYDIIKIKKFKSRLSDIKQKIIKFNRELLGI